MPSKKYCECGAVTEYGSTVPKFCSGCGSPFGALTTAKRPQPPQPSTPPALSEDDNQEDHTPIPQLNKLEVDFLDAPRKMTVADMAFQKPSKDKFRRPTRKISAKKAMEEFRREAGGVKTPSIGVGIGRGEQEGD